ncbi:hypothetical protein Tamer19_38280 [Cupriavidus sp. TA19]|uniref:hypothetical protein n=1 Tax=unclassified Cupriavidus TaxID=2640874 RepID=UPI001314494D|nr:MULTISPECIES: hypothetical protein [unclassified Cupriavidus]BDB29726.1 hypothetical protein CTP10_R71410 [Cupriavidus sp. P-10]GLC94420.1 hypothetical protein Tamer19_38280 [Cupriavidus sp. TA19]
MRAQAANEDERLRVNKSLIWRVLLIVFAVIGVLASLGAVGMLVMHQRMMGGFGLC